MLNDEKMISVLHSDQEFGFRVEGDLGFAEGYAMKGQGRASSTLSLLIHDRGLALAD